MWFGLEFAIFIILLFVVARFLGRYMFDIFADNSKRKIPVLSFLETATYWICGIDAKQEMTWKNYALAVLYFNVLGLVFLFFLQLAQGILPFNPQSLPGVEPVLAFNTAVSFVTNTNWQAYGGETTMSYLTQATGLTVQNFLSAATGNGVLLALIRGIARRSTNTIGNFWVDVTRTLYYLLLPACFIFALFLVTQGVIQNIQPYVQAKTMMGEVQNIPMGPVASQVAIKQLGTNGGGYFNANSAHPFENPTPATNFLEAFAIFCIPAAATYMFGLMVKAKRQGLLLFNVMFILWLAGIGVAFYSESVINPVLEANPVLEGIETRFGIRDSIVWAVTTTGTSNGSVNNMHESLSPLAGGVLLFNMMIGEVIWGGIGVGLCGMLMFVLLTVFLAGLMVGRTPEYLGKKIEKFEIQWVVLAVLLPSALILFGAAIASVLPVALESLANTGPHGLSEILYAFSSAAGNNGSAFAGLNANTYFYNTILGVIMLLTRSAILLSSLAIAGGLVQKNRIAPSLGTFQTDQLLFAILLISVIFIVAALTFFPALCLGPIIEQILMSRGRAF